MMAVLPFVQKLLEPCKDSRVFKPTNPFIEGILSLLAEIHRMPRLRLNIAFTVEMLFKHFNLELNNYPPSDILKDLPRVALGTNGGNNDFNINLGPTQDASQAATPLNASSTDMQKSMQPAAPASLAGGPPGMPPAQAGARPTPPPDSKPPLPGEAPPPGSAAPGMLPNMPMMPQVRPFYVLHL